MGIIKISDQVHDDIRRASTVMSRSINAQAEFWIKIGRLAERNPTLTFAEIIQIEMEKADGFTEMSDAVMNDVKRNETESSGRKLKAVK